MILQTGGSAFATISTKSRSASSAALIASASVTMPFCSPSAATRRTSFARISSLIAGRFDFALCCLLRSGCLIAIYSTIYRPRSATAAFTRSTKASIDIVPKFVPERVRTFTVPSSTSRSPRTNK